jgi:hypothetical protein
VLSKARMRRDKRDGGKGPSRDSRHRREQHGNDKGKFAKVGDSGILNCKTRWEGLWHRATITIVPLESGRKLGSPLLGGSPIMYLLQTGRPQPLCSKMGPIIGPIT